MKGINKVIIVGTLGKDPETRYFPNGDAVATTSVATSEQWTDKASGDKKEATEWHSVVFHRKLAEIAAQYLKKGSNIYLEGKLKTRKWEKDGQTHYSTEILVSEMQMLNSKDRPQESAKPKAKEASKGGHAPSSVDDFNDQIPF